MNGDIVANPLECLGVGSQLSALSPFCRFVGVLLDIIASVAESLASQSRAPHKISDDIGSYTRLFEMRHVPTVL